MKTLRINYLLVLLSLLAFSCVKEYDAPPLKEPVYDGEANRTIAALKEIYKDVTTSALIEFDYVIRGRIIGNDESGNIFKQLYLEDETGGIVIGVEQSNMYGSFRIGQEVFIKTHGMYMVKYGGEFQLGDAKENASRLKWTSFIERVHFNGHPDVGKAAPSVVKINELSDKHVNTLVRFNKVSFVNGGKNNFTKNDNTTEEAFKDENGNALNIRTSSFSDFADELLPEGTGSIVGVLGRYNGSWQLMIRDLDDLIDFKEGGGTTDPDPDPNPGETFFYETFGTGTHGSGNRPAIDAFTGYDMKSPVVYSDPTGNADIRTISGVDAHVWMPLGKDTKLVIQGINTTGKENLVFSFQLAANLYDDGASINLNVVQVKVDNQLLTIPSTVVSKENGDNSKYYTFTFEGKVPAKENLEIEFTAPAAGNTLGLRLDNIKLAAKE